VAGEIVLPGADAGADVGTAAERRAARDWLARHPGWFVCAFYLAAAAALTWRLWAGLGTVSVAGDPGPADNDLMAWFLRYAATAVAHGHLPALVTSALNAPTGFPLLWNNSVLFPAVLLAPVTLLAGPLAALTVLTTLGYAGSAAALYWVLRRYGASVLAAALGGAVFGFSPGLVNAGLGHYGMQFAVAAPLMLEAAAAIVTGRGSRVRAGLRLGLLAAAQLYTGEEMLTDVSIAGLVLVAVLALSRPRAVRARLAGAVAGLATAAVVTLAVTGYGLWVQFHGPLTEHGTPWYIARHGNPLGAFVNPQSQLLFHTAVSAAYAATYHSGTGEYVAYLGPPLLVVAALVTVCYWRDLRVRTAGVIWVVLELLSLGVNGPWLPLHWLQALPLLSDMFPSRMSILADGAAAAVLAFGLDQARSPARRPAGEPLAPRTAGPLRRFLPPLIALLAVLPLIPRPVAALTAAPVPAGWDTVFTRLRLPSDASVLVVPLPYSQQGEAMLWQADTGQPSRLTAGWFLGPSASGYGDDAYWGPAFTSRTVQCLDGLWLDTITPGATAASDCAAAFTSALRYWHPGAVVADTSPGSPLGQFLIQALGPPDVAGGQLLGWRNG
jgi:hypothetical protein